jgi:DNA-binding response OmpR family regulator
MSNQTPTILLVETDDETRPVLRQNLQRYGYHVSVALDVEDALDRTAGGRLQPDLILVNVVGVSNEQSLRDGLMIRRNAELDGRTPVVAMAEHYGEEMEGKDVLAGENAYITYLEDGLQLKELLARLVPTA